MKVGQEEQTEEFKNYHRDLNVKVFENLQSVIQVRPLALFTKSGTSSIPKYNCPFYKGLKISQKEQFQKFRKHQEEQNLKVIENLKQEIQVKTYNA